MCEMNMFGIVIVMNHYCIAFYFLSVVLILIHPSAKLSQLYTRLRQFWQGAKVQRYDESVRH